MPPTACSSSDSPALREQLIASARALVSSGLTHGTSGNVSVRIDTGCLITPTGIDYEALVETDIVALDSQGQYDPAGRKPSSEWRMHHDIYAAREDVHAIVHAHPTYSTALACTHRDIPAFHYEVALAGGDNIRCAGYETYGTQALSDVALEALADRTACLLANHGMLALGETLDSAFKLAQVVEALAQQYLVSLTISGPKLIAGDKLTEVIDKISNYGKQ